MIPSQTPSTATLAAGQERAKDLRSAAIRAAWDALPTRFRLSLPGFGAKREDAVC